MTGTAPQLRDLIARDENLCCPGVHDSQSATVADSIGFEALYMTGYGSGESL